MSKATSTFGDIDLDALGFESDSRDESPEHTRIAVANVLAVAISQCEHGDEPSRGEPSASSRSVPSTSGVAARSHREDKVMAIRELYAHGHADMALALAAELADDVDDLDAAPVATDADPYGGLIPVAEDGFGEVEEDFELDDDADHTMMGDAAVDSSRLAAMTSHRVPRLLLGPRQIATLPMDPRMGFLLGHIDGVQSMEEILDVCAMPEGDALELLERLRAMGVIAVD